MCRLLEPHLLYLYSVSVCTSPTVSDPPLSTQRHSSLSRPATSPTSASPKRLKTGHREGRLPAPASLQLRPGLGRCVGQHPSPACGALQGHGGGGSAPSQRLAATRLLRRRSPVSAAPCRRAAAAVGEPLGGGWDGRGRVPGREPPSPQGWVPRGAACRAGSGGGSHPGSPGAFLKGTWPSLKRPARAVLRWSGFGLQPGSPWQPKCEGALVFTSASAWLLPSLG